MATWYCDYTNGNDTTGDGSSGTPYKTLQKCVDVATGGDTINIANTSAQVLVAAITWNTGWTADNTKYTTIQSWDNGGAITIQRPDEATARVGATISPGGGVTNSFNTASIPQKITIINIHFKDFSDRGIKLQTQWQLFGCEFSGNATVLLQCDANQVLIENCYLHDSSTSFYNVQVTGGEFRNNYLDNLQAGSESSWAIIYGNSPHNRIIGNVIIINNSSDTAIRVENVANYFINNTVKASGGTNQFAIYASNSSSDQTILNNVFYKFDGSGSKPIFFGTSTTPRVVSYNAYYDCNAADSPTSVGYSSGNITGSGDPFVDSANGDFTLLEASAARQAALTNPNSKLDMGAVQSEYGSGGGGGSFAFASVG